MVPGAGARDHPKTPTARRDRRGGLVVSCDPQAPPRSSSRRRPLHSLHRVSHSPGRDLHRAAPAHPARSASSSSHRKPSSSPVAAPRGQAWASAPHDHGNRSQRRTAREARGTAGVRQRQHGPRARGDGPLCTPPHPEGVRYGTAQRRTALPPPSVGSPRPPVVCRRGECVCAWWAQEAGDRG